jgi:hypothetical protein
VDGDALANLRQITDPRAARLSRRVLEGQIHMLEAQIAQLGELARRLEQQEGQLEKGSGEAVPSGRSRQRGESHDHTRP